MNYTRYTIASDQQTILAEVVTIAETECSQCGATWLPGLSPQSCPYCGHQHFIESDSKQLFTLAESASSYGRDIRGVVRALWNGSVDIDQADENFVETVRIYLTRAYYAGARECGVAPDELSVEERNQLRSIITNETVRVFSFLLDVEKGNKAAGILFRNYRGRIRAWTNRYPDTQGRAQVTACSNMKTQWTLGKAEHCSSCIKLAGKVKRNSFWQRKGVLPRVPNSPYLECRGFL